MLEVLRQEEQLESRHSFNLSDSNSRQAADASCQYQQYQPYQPYQPLVYQVQSRVEVEHQATVEHEAGRADMAAEWKGGGISGTMGNRRSEGSLSSFSLASWESSPGSTAPPQSHSPHTVHHPALSWESSPGSTSPLPRISAGPDATDGMLTCEQPPRHTTAAGLRSMTSPCLSLGPCSNPQGYHVNPSLAPSTIEETAGASRSSFDRPRSSFDRQFESKRSLPASPFWTDDMNADGQPDGIFSLEKTMQFAAAIRLLLRPLRPKAWAPQDIPQKGTDLEAQVAKYRGIMERRVAAHASDVALATC